LYCQFFIPEGGVKIFSVLKLANFPGAFPDFYRVKKIFSFLAPACIFLIGRTKFSHFVEKKNSLPLVCFPGITVWTFESLVSFLLSKSSLTILVEKYRSGEALFIDTLPLKLYL